MTAAIHEDAFNLLCHNLLGEGIHRKVFTCRIRDDLVVKVEKDDLVFRSFSNVMESKFYTDNMHAPAIAKWLAPSEFLSPDGRIMLQKRCEPIRKSDVLPDQLPAFLTDIKRENFGWLDGQLVCMDYAFHIENVSIRLRKINWD